MVSRLNVELVNIDKFYFPNDHYSTMSIAQKEAELKFRKDSTYFVTEEENMRIIWNVFDNARSWFKFLWGKENYFNKLYLKKNYSSIKILIVFMSCFCFNRFLYLEILQVYQDIKKLYKTN